MTVLREFRLGDDGRQHVRERLGLGKTLSRLVLETCDLKRGEVVSFLPLETSEEEARRFGAGGKLPPPPASARRLMVGEDGSRWIMEEKPTTDAFLAGMIHDFLSAERRVCLFEDAKSSASDPHVQAKSERVTLLGDEVYYVLVTADAADDEKIITTIRYADSLWHFLCVMASLPMGRELSKDAGYVTVEEMRVVAERAEKVAVGAYDGEGYVIWERREASPVFSSPTFDGAPPTP